MKLYDLELDLNTSHELIEVLRFYGDPTIYARVAIFADPPNREIASDFEATEIGMKPGKRARAMLHTLNDLAIFEQKKEISMSYDSQPDAMEVRVAAEIEEQVNILRNQVNNLAEWLSKLEARIEPILVADFDNEKAMAEESCNTVHGNEIRDIRMSVEGLVRQTGRLVDRVAL